MRLGLTLFAVAMLFVAGCDKNSSDNNEENAYSFPLQLGNHWTYRLTFTDDEYGSDQLVIFNVDCTTDSLLTAPNGQVCTRFHYLVTDSTSDWISADYLANEDNGLYMLGNENSNCIVFHHRRYPFSFWNGINTVSSRSAWWESSGKILPYPATTGTTWRFYPESSFIPSIHTIVGTTEVTVPAGTYQCLHKHITFDSDSTFTQFQYDFYYGSPGLVYAFMDFGDEVITDDQGTPIDTVRAIGTYELLNYTPAR